MHKAIQWACTAPKAVSTIGDEQHLYGSSRTGIWNWNNLLPARPPVADASNPTVTDSLLLGSRSYELSNHLGNVLAVISDKKIGVANTTTPTLVDYYKAEVLRQNDYYPFGMQMPGRTFTVGSNYRYGFNGKENDNEVKNKEGSQLDYGMRIYDTRLGRFLSVDPLTKTYPWYTPYQFAGNMPIVAVDLDGKEPYLITPYSIRNAGKVTLKVLKGAGNVILQSFGAITQIGGAMEYGDKVSKDKFAQQFPLIANDNIAKDLILPMFATPVDLAKKLRENPADAELWGQALGILALVKGGSYAGKITSGEFGLKVDLMGGIKSKYKGYINYDMNATSGINDGVSNFKNHFGEGTIRDMVVDNPQASFLNEVAGSIAKDGTVTIRGQMSNKFFKTIWNGTEEGLKGFEVMPNSKKTGLSNEGYTKSDGTPLGGSNNLNEITLRKK